MRPPLTGIVIALLVAAACSKPAEPLKVTGVDLAHQLNADNTVTSASETFTSGQTVYASIVVEGTGPGTLAARWTTADGQVLAEQTQTIAPTAPAHFEFHLAPPGGWPKGRHKVIFTLNGANPRTREFDVR